MLTDAHRLLLLVRRMPVDEFATVFRQDLGAPELMQVITALPPGRLNTLMDHVRQSAAQALSQPTQPERQQHRPLATEIRQARKHAGMSQVELAAALGIRQSSVSQWERAATEPATQNLLDLMRLLPGLAEGLSATAAQRARADQPGPAADRHG